MKFNPSQGRKLRLKLGTSNIHRFAFLPLRVFLFGPAEGTPLRTLSSSAFRLTPPVLLTLTRSDLPFNPVLRATCNSASCQSALEVSNADLDEALMIRNEGNGIEDRQELTRSDRERQSSRVVVLGASSFPHLQHQPVPSRDPHGATSKTSRS